MYNYIATYKQTTSLNLVLSSIKYEMLLIICTSELFLELPIHKKYIWQLIIQCSYVYRLEPYSFKSACYPFEQLPLKHEAYNMLIMLSLCFGIMCNFQHVAIGWNILQFITLRCISLCQNFPSVEHVTLVNTFIKCLTNMSVTQ